MSNRKRQPATPADDVVTDEEKMGFEISPVASHSYPAHWVKGQLLDLRKFTDGTARATVLGEEYDPQAANAVHFDSLWAAQTFLSTWYERPYVR